MEERDRKIRDRDKKLRKLTAELAKCDATIRLFTVELGERHTKIGELTAEVGDYDRKLRKHAAELAERDEKIREHEAEIRRLTELLEDRDLEARNQDALIRKLTEELEELKGLEAEESDLERGERDAKIDELSAEMEKRDRKIDELTAELEEYKAKMRKCMEEHRKEEEKLANVTLDPETAHPRLILSKDQKSVRWEYMLQESPDSPERFDADPCVLGCEAFTSGRHYWVVDLAEGQYCAVGVSRESLPRKGPVSFNPEEGIWAVQQWGFKNRALTSPPTLLNLPRVPKKIRISLDYEWGEVAFFDVENKVPIFTFPPASFAGERIRPWFWVELGSLSLVR
ncbi:tripartite motif-containing protein 10-like [Aythya fuligula]|uniref:Tripartite motif-containing protein 10-like n=1 Tax=Aythya fuligula TaxID=219594 RepID=A0A6J3EG76_AYTFU|nr:tripartite motif-containing protein 10-like [Aythya fuligula]